MAEPQTIPRGGPENPGLDYAALREEGVALLQRLAGDVWTDYNEHDPGVTTLEQLCYALTELSYRAEFPTADLLTDPRTGRIDTRRHTLFIPRRILTCNPTTEDDYRKLFVDRVPGVANAWLTPYAPPDPAKYVGGLYDVALYAPGADPCVCDGELTPAAVARRVRRVYCRHRGLCEDLHAVTVLKPLRAAVYADVNIEHARAPEATLAEIFFNVGLLFAPELRRSSLKAMLDRGLTADQIFNGPLLKNGFIDDGQLQPKASDIPVRDVVRAIVQSRGVAGVRNVRVKVGDGVTYFNGDSIPVPATRILQLDMRADRQNGGFTVRLFKDGIEYEPDPLRVRRELDKLWAEYRTTYTLGPQYEQYFAVPRGVRRDLETYYSIQQQYPDAYGIGDNGLPAGATRMRRGQAKQLKGYLLVFEQLMADYFAQLEHVRDLYSTETAPRQTYFYQYLYDSVPDVRPLLKEDYPAGLARLVERQDPYDERRNRFLNFLLALYAEGLDASEVAGSAGAPRDEGEGGRLIRAKLALLRHLVAATHDRARGFDYLGPDTPTNVAGMEIKCRIQLGIDPLEHRPLADLLDESAVEVAHDNAHVSYARPLGRHADHIEQNFVPVAAEAEAGEGAANVQPATLSGQTVSEEFITAAADIENYRVGSLPGEAATALVCKSPADEVWRLVGKYPDAETASAAARATCEAARNIIRHGRQLYIVEHLLLRFGRSKRADPPRRDARDAGEAEEFDDKKFGYSFTVTAVVAGPPAPGGEQDWRTFVREVVRQNAPAHIVTEFCFLSLAELRRFEPLYWSWRRALRRGRNLIDPTKRLRDFLRRCRVRAGGADA